MSDQSKWDTLKRFTGSENFYQHWTNPKMIYTDGVHHFAAEFKSYWLIDVIGHVLLPQLLEKFKDRFYYIEFQVFPDATAIITINNGNGRVLIEHEIKWTDFPVTKEPVKFYLCASEDYYCLMLPSEY